MILVFSIAGVDHYASYPHQESWIFIEMQDNYLSLLIGGKVVKKPVDMHHAIDVTAMPMLLVNDGIGIYSS